MNCYLHRDTSAIGVCKYCMKGVCSDCASIVGTSISCKGDCEHKVAAINLVQEKQVGVVAVASFSQKAIPLIAVVYGLYIAISWSGFFDFPLNRGLLLTGIIFVVFGALLFAKTRKKPKI